MSQPTLQEALNEEYIEVSKSVPETVRYLEEQSCERTGKCPVPMPNRMRMLFKCSKQGDIKVTSDFGLFRKWGYFLFPLIFLFYVLCPVYFVRGEVISKDDKTYVKIAPAYKRSHIVIRNFWIALGALLILTLYVPEAFELTVVEFLGARRGLPMMAFLFCLFAYLAAIVYAFVLESLHQKNAPLAISLMKEEVKRRVHNIERWED